MKRRSMSSNYKDILAPPRSRSVVRRRSNFEKPAFSLALRPAFPPTRESSETTGIPQTLCFKVTCSESKIRAQLRH